MLKKFNDDELVGIFSAVLKKANEKLNEYPPIVERVLILLYAKYVAFGIPFPSVIHAPEIAKALSSPEHEVTDLMVIEALIILIVEGIIPLGTAALLH